MEIKKDLIDTKVMEFLIEVIEGNVPYSSYSTEEPFITFKGTIAYDYSGEVELFTLKKLDELYFRIQENGFNHWYTSNNDEFLSNIHVNQWTPTYNSGYGKHWVNYKDLLVDKFREWKFDFFPLYDEITEDIDDELEMEIDEVFDSSLNDISFDFVHRKIKERMK